MANGRPFGNDFIVSTPALDSLGQRLYAEERQRQAQNQSNIKALDDEFSKNVSNIRDADVDDLTKVYQDYKQSTQANMRKKDGVSPQEQMEVLRKKAAMYKLINESKAEREREETYGKRYAIKPDDFNDNAAELLIKGRQLPLSQKRGYKTVGADGKEVVIDLTNPENILWQDKTNWQPILQKAGGTLTQRGQPVIVDLPGGLEQEITTYKGGNDPVEYYQSIVGAMNTPRASQSLASRYNFTPEEAQDIMMKFEELKKTPAFKNAYGDVKFPESAGISQGGKTAMLLAMTNAINNPPTANAPIRKAKLAEVTANRQQFAIDQQQRAYKNSISKMYQYFNLLEASDANITAKAEELYNNNYNSRDPQTGEVPTNDETKEAIFGKKGGVMIIDADGNYIRATKDADNKLTPTGEKASKEEAIIRIRGNIKNNLPKKVQPGGQSVRTPKDIKNTKMTTKPTKPKPY